jgi:hypothetical protein
VWADAIASAGNGAQRKSHAGHHATAAEARTGRGRGWRGSTMVVVLKGRRKGRGMNAEPVIWWDGGAVQKGKNKSSKNKSAPAIGDPDNLIPCKSFDLK